VIAAIISALGGLLAALPGPIAQAVTGGQSVEDAIAAGRKAAEALPEREAAGGDDTAGAWDRDLEERKRRGEERKP
jgi:hypothetical protein